MGTDVTEISSPCLCGRGSIVVTQSMPDHPWVREGQISYAAEIACPTCAESFVVQHDYHSLPSIVRREDLAKRSAAAARTKAAENEVSSSEQARRLVPRVVSAIDSHQSMAAKHRALQRFNLSYESLGTYRKRPYDGAHAIRTASCRTLAEIGSNAEMGGEDTDYFVAAAKNISALSALERAIEVNPVKTNARWIRF